MDMQIAVKETLEAFENLKSVCRFRSIADPNDCGHHDIDFQCVSCCPANCPLLLEEL